MTGPRPYNLVAELTYRCPLRCAYCSNPVRYRDVRDALDTQDWLRVFREAAALGAVHVGLTGGEPALRPDLEALVAGASEAKLYTHLVTAGTTLDGAQLDALKRAGLKSIQLSVQDAEPHAANEMAGVAAHERKLAFAAAVRERGFPLSLNVVLHRRNLTRVGELIELAQRLDVDRLELANTQYYGWALLNRDALLPTRAQLAAAQRTVDHAKRTLRRPEILFVLPDYLADRPKPCMGGWGRKIAVVAPDGRVLPCHAAGELPDLEFWNVREHTFAECWNDAPGLAAYRGEAWMPEPCRSCPERGRDFGGCRCQAFQLTGDASATDPACSLAPSHGEILAARERAERGGDTPLTLRGGG